MSTSIPDTTTRADLYWLARGTTLTAIRALPRKASAAAILAAWDYRAAGLIVDQARAEIAEHTPRHSYRQRRHQRGQWEPRHDQGLIWHMMLHRREERTQHAARIAAAVAPAAWLSWRPAWDSCIRALSLPGGLLLRTVRDEVCEWGRKRGNWPTSRSTSYRTTLHRGDRGEISAAVQHDGRGDWRARVLAELHLARPVRDATLPMRMHPCCRMSRAHALADGIQVARRTLAGAPVDVVAWAADGTTYHADDVRAAIAGLARKRALAAGRSTGYTLSVELAHDRWGFCRRGLAEFAAAVCLDAAAEYSRSEVAAALTPEARDTYAREIATAGL